MDALITVVVSAFNSEAWLRECLQQLCKQTAIDLCEVVVIDSGSDQDEAVVCRELSPKFPNLIYDRTDRETLYAAWNRGLSRARGQYFVNVNTDDALAPDSLECFVEAMEKEPGAALAYADCVWSPLPNAPHPWPDSWRHVYYEPYTAEAALFYCFTSCTQFWRTSSLRELGGFDASLKAAGDYEILCRLAGFGMKATHVSKVLSAFYQNARGISQSGSSSNDEFLAVRDCFRRHVDLVNIYGENEFISQDLCSARLSLAMRAFNPRIPWHDTPVPELDYARENLRVAMHHADALPVYCLLKMLSNPIIFRTVNRFFGAANFSRLAIIVISLVQKWCFGGIHLPQNRSE